jgi:hypothetical protein
MSPHPPEFGNMGQPAIHDPHSSIIGGYLCLQEKVMLIILAIFSGFLVLSAGKELIVKIFLLERSKRSKTCEDSF